MPITPLPPVPNVIKLVNQCQGNDGRLAENVLHFTYIGAAPSGSDCIAFAERWWGQWVAHFTAHQPTSTSLTLVTVTDLSTDVGGIGEYDNGSTPVPGTSEGGLLPLHSCALMSSTILQRYRGGHPRTYWPIGTTTDLTDDGDWAGASLTAWNTAYLAILASFLGFESGSTSIGQQCAVSYYGGAPTVDGKSVRREVPEVYDVSIDGYIWQAKLATQRRRVRKTERRR